MIRNDIPQSETKHRQHQPQENESQHSKPVKEGEETKEPQDKTKFRQDKEEKGPQKVHQHQDQPKASHYEAAKKWQTPLQRHVAFFDRNDDGFISPVETFQGFRAIGFNILLSFLAVLIIHSSMAYPSQEGWLPDPLFRIGVKNIHRSKHGSDSGLYDIDGNINYDRLNEIIEKYDADRKNGLSFKEGFRMIREHRNIWDPYGWFAAMFEWGSFYLLMADKKGIVPATAIREMFDGSLFFNLEQANLQKQK
eukprot:gene4823-5288_t